MLGLTAIVLLIWLSLALVAGCVLGRFIHARSAEPPTQEHAKVRATPANQTN
jgi:uncharacterized protein YneF (UPF0154 family)